MQKFLDTIPHEILDSRLFKFEVSLPSVFEMACTECPTIMPDNTDRCTSCGTLALKRRCKKICIDVMANISLDYETVERVIHNIPAELAFWGSVYAEVKFRVNLLERAVKTQRSIVHQAIIDEAHKAGTRLAQDSIKILVEKEESVNKAETLHAEAWMHASKLHYMVEAIKMKADLGRSLMSLKRSESNGS